MIHLALWLLSAIFLSFIGVLIVMILSRFWSRADNWIRENSKPVWRR